MSPNPWAMSIANDVLLSKAFFPTWDAKILPCILEGDRKPFTFLLGVRQTTVQEGSWPGSQSQGFSHGLSRRAIAISLLHCCVATGTLANIQNESQITTLRVMVLMAALRKPCVFSVDNHLHLVVHLRRN